MMHIKIYFNQYQYINKERKIKQIKINQNNKTLQNLFLQQNKQMNELTQQSQEIINNGQNNRKYQIKIDSIQVYQNNNIGSSYKRYSNCLNEILQSFRQLLNQSNPNIDSTVVKEKITYLFTPYINHLNQEDSRLIVKVLKEIFYLSKGIKKKLFYIRIVHHLLANYSIFNTSISTFLPQMLRTAVRTAFLEEKGYIINQFKCLFKIWGAFLNQSCLQSIRNLVFNQQKCDLSDFQAHHKLLSHIVKITPLSKENRARIMQKKQANGGYNQKQTNFTSQKKGFFQFNPNLMVNGNNRNKFSNNSNFKKLSSSYMYNGSADQMNNDETETNLNSEYKEEYQRMFDFDLIINGEDHIQKDIVNYNLSIYLKNQVKGQVNHLQKLKNMKNMLMEKKRQKGWQILVLNGKFQDSQDLKGKLCLDEQLCVYDYQRMRQQYKKEEKQLNGDYVQLFDHEDESLLECHQCKFCNGLLPVVKKEGKRRINNAICFKFVSKYMTTKRNLPIFRCDIDDDDIIFGIYLLHIDCYHYIMTGDIKNRVNKVLNQLD